MHPRGFKWTEDFNPRSQSRERHKTEGEQMNDVIISIHAPNLGSDDFVDVRFFAHDISIHAPNLGSDFAKYELMQYTGLFQSTLPI